VPPTWQVTSAIIWYLSLAKWVALAKYTYISRNFIYVYLAGGMIIMYKSIYLAGGEMINLENIKNFILEKTLSNIEKFDDKLPSATENGKYKFIDNGGWVGGFWNGLNNLCYEMSGNEKYLETTRKSHHRYIERLYKAQDTLDHDTGFLYILPFVADYKITGNEYSRQIALDAAKFLRGRFNEKGQFIQCWNVWTPGDAFSEENRGRVIIDSMFNIPLLFWAYEETGDMDFYRVAVAHAKTCEKYIIREDYTAFHTYVFDHETGEPKYGRTHQGYSDESCWARGLSWAIGGFTYAYRYSKDEGFLNTARKCAEVFIKNLEEDCVSMWDFSLPSKAGEPLDTSATAITATGLLELSTLLPKGEGKYYRETAEKMIQSLYENYSTKALPEDEGLIIHACGHKPYNSDIDCSLIYGDYYFVEAVARLLGSTKAYW
jgi:unsaturated chondroitin disaccharide hydrolase